MYTLSAYYHKSKIDFMDKKHPLFIGSCGTYHLYTIEKLPTHRPKGRLDYQLLYIASGRAHFYFDGKPTVVEAGNMVLYRPERGTTLLLLRGRSDRSLLGSLYRE